MKKWIIAGLTSLFCATSMTAFAADITDSSTSVSFPDKVTFKDGDKTYNLNATGTATRKKLIVKVYSVASYLQDNATGGSKFERLLNDDFAKQLTITWVRDVTVEQIQGGFKESIINNVPASDKAAIQPLVDQFLSFFNAPASKGSSFSLRWLPGGKIQKVENDKVVGTIDNKVFAKALWSVWFGDKSVVDKEKLSGLMK